MPINHGPPQALPEEAWEGVRPNARQSKGCPLSPVPSSPKEPPTWIKTLQGGVAVTHSPPPPEALGAESTNKVLFFPGENRGEAWTSSTKFPELLRRAGCPRPPPRATAEQEPCNTTSFPLRQQRQGHSCSRAPTSQGSPTSLDGFLPRPSSIPAPRSPGSPRGLPGSSLPRG